MLALDAAMGIFNNVPSRINYCELDLQLSCHSGAFELASHMEMVQRSAYPRPRVKLVEAFRKLFVHPTELKAAYRHETLGSWDMLVLVHGTLSKLECTMKILTVVQSCLRISGSSFSAIR
jgi:hypothetical protein